MNLPISSPIPSYLDPQQLGDLLKLSERTVILRAKHRPWLLPPRAQLFDHELLRWRRDVAALWLGSDR
jgi:hypothetical protein